MAIVLSASAAQPFSLNGEVLGGFVTGSLGKFVSLPRQGTDVESDNTKPTQKAALISAFTGSAGGVTIIEALNQAYIDGQTGDPGGSDTAIQFNDSETFGGSDNFTWNDDDLEVTGGIHATIEISSAADVKAGGDLYVHDDAFLRSDSAVLNFGADSDVKLTHVADTGLLLNTSRQLQFRDSGLHIQSLENGHLGITADVALSLTGAVKTSAGLVLGTSLGMTGSIAGATTIAASGLASLGSVAVDNGSTIGTDSDTDMLTLTNASDVTVASDLQLRFRDSGLHIQSLEDGHLGITADKAISLTGTVRANGNLVLGGNLGLTGSIAGATTVTATGKGTFDGGLEVDTDKFTVSAAGAVLAAGLAELDGGVNINDQFTLSNLGVLDSEAGANFADNITIDKAAGTGRLVISGANGHANSPANAGYIQFPGSDSDGMMVDYKLQVSGGILKVVVV